MGESSSGGGSGWGCLPLLVFILVAWALWFGLPTPWGVFGIDVFPPRITLNGK